MGRLTHQTGSRVGPVSSEAPDPLIWLPTSTAQRSVTIHGRLSTLVGTASPRVYTNNLADGRSAADGQRQTGHIWSEALLIDGTRFARMSNYRSSVASVYSPALLPATGPSTTASYGTRSGIASPLRSRSNVRVIIHPVRIEHMLAVRMEA